MSFYSIGRHIVAIERQKTNKMLINAIVRKVKGKYIRKEQIKEWKDLIKQGIRICFVPEEIKTSRFCEEAVLENPKNIYFVPNEIKTKKMCKIFINKFHIIKDMPENLLDEKICDEVVKNNPEQIQYIPDRLKTLDMCKRAYMWDEMLIYYIPLKYHDNLPEIDISYD